MDSVDEATDEVDVEAIYEALDTTVAHPFAYEDEAAIAIVLTA